MERRFCFYNLKISNLKNKNTFAICKVYACTDINPNYSQKHLFYIIEQPIDLNSIIYK